MSFPKEVKNGGPVGGQVSGFKVRQKEIYDLIVANPRVSRKELVEILGINESAIQKHTDALKKKKVIKRDSETTGHWLIIYPPNPRQKAHLKNLLA